MAAKVTFVIRADTERSATVGNRFTLGTNTTDAAENASCPKCGGSKPTCCSCPPLPIAIQAQELVDRWLVDRRLLDQAFITMQDRQVLAERITLLLTAPVPAAVDDEGKVGFYDFASAFIVRQYGPCPDPDADPEGEERWHARLGLVAQAVGEYAQAVLRIVNNARGTNYDLRDIAAQITALRSGEGEN